ncbi:MAG: hydrogenase 3 maturation endopeptidase HyCI [Candidatus Omnitrophica bacterium]|nr:hydrogenase 3 maturation endopeptidase HyCI [Candidatus Omnitrophota bacterium]
MVLEQLRTRLKGKVVIVGIGNTLRQDDGIGAILANRLKGKVPYTVFDSGASPENYLGKITAEKADVVLFIDAVDFGGEPGELRLIEGDELSSANMYFTHNASLALNINYLKSSLGADIIILIIQPKSIAFGNMMSKELDYTLDKLENWFYGRQEKG